jgi:hypothetical protein
MAYNKPKTLLIYILFKYIQKNFFIWQIILRGIFSDFVKNRGYEFYKSTYIFGFLILKLV